MNNENIELSGIPERLGTSKCYECHRDPTQEEIQKSNEEDLAPFWDIFVEYYGEMKPVPICPECMPKYSIPIGTVIPNKEED